MADDKLREIEAALAFGWNGDLKFALNDQVIPAREWLQYCVGEIERLRSLEGLRPTTGGK